jgi:serine/threonine protein kinase
MIVDAQESSPAAVRRFTIETAAAATLNHPNIFSIYEVGHHEQHPFFSMKLVEGESLKETLAKAGNSRNEQLVK